MRWLQHGTNLQEDHSPHEGCAMVKSRYIGDGRPPTFDRNPYNGYINPYYWVDDHPLLYGNNGSLDPGTNDFLWIELGMNFGSLFVCLFSGGC